MNCDVDYWALKGPHSKIMLLTLTCSGASTPDLPKHLNYRWEIHTDCMHTDECNYVSIKQVSSGVEVYAITMH